MVAIPEKPEDPPAYSAAEFDDSSASSSQGVPPPRRSTARHPSATNFLTIFHPNNAIKGTYIIDPALPMPSAAPEGEGGTPLNLRVGSRNGAVDAAVELVRSGDVKGPAQLEVFSENGNVSVAVRDDQLTRFHLRAASRNGGITVFIPRTFLGTLSTQLRNGTLTLSPALQAGLTTFSEHAGERRYFLGDHVAAGYAGEETWHGDHVSVEALNGSVRLKFVDERATPGISVAEGTGFFSKWFA